MNNEKWRNGALWSLTVGLVLSGVKQGAELFGYTIPDETINSVADLGSTLITILGAWGVLTIPPTNIKK